jgi:hypothetical protein
MEHALIAAKLVRSYGSRSLEAIAAYRERAGAIGDQPSVQTWRTIGAAAENLLTRSGEAKKRSSRGSRDGSGLIGRLRPPVEL